MDRLRILNTQKQIRTDKNPSKLDRIRILSENIHTIYIPTPEYQKKITENSMINQWEDRIHLKDSTGKIKGSRTQLGYKWQRYKNHRIPVECPKTPNPDRET